MFKNFNFSSSALIFYVAYPGSAHPHLESAFGMRIPDADPGDQNHADPCGCGSATLLSCSTYSYWGLCCPARITLHFPTLNTMPHLTGHAFSRSSAVCIVTLSDSGWISCWPLVSSLSFTIKVSRSETPPLLPNHRRRGPAHPLGHPHSTGYSHLSDSHMSAFFSGPFRMPKQSPGKNITLRHHPLALFIACSKLSYDLYDGEERNVCI